MSDDNPLQWSHNESDGISNHQCLNCLLNCLFRCKSKKASKLCVTGLCEGNSPVTGEFPAQRASNVENVSIWWRYHASDGRRQSISRCDTDLHPLWIWNIPDGLTTAFHLFCTKFGAEYMPSLLQTNDDKGSSSRVTDLTHCGLVMLYGHIDLGQDSQR